METQIVNLEKLTRKHFDSPKLIFILGAESIQSIQDDLQSIQDEEMRGGLYRAVIFESEAVGIVFISSDKDCSAAIHPDYQQRGLATKAISMLVKVAFEELNFERMTAHTQIDRPGSKLASKFGFKEISRSDTEIFYEYTVEMWRTNNA